MDAIYIAAPALIERGYHPTVRDFVCVSSEIRFAFLICTSFSPLHSRLSESGSSNLSLTYKFLADTLDPFLLIAICPKNETGGYVSCCPNEVGDDHCSCQDEFVSWRLWEQTPITTIGPTANLTTRHVSRSSTESTSFSLNSFSSTTPNQTNTSLETGVSSSTSVFTLAIGAKAGIGVGIFLGVIIMMIPSFLLWRSKRKNRFSKEKASVQDQITKAEMDADESQRPDYRARELSGDMAHELRGEKDANNRWELLGDEAHELRGEDDANEMWELPGDEAHELRGEHHVHDGCELPGDTAHKVSSSGGRNGIRVEELPGDIVNNGG